MFVPAVLALVVFPTPMIDTRELLAWGRAFPLTTHKHPPMMVWLGGALQLLFPPTAFWAILVGQILNAVGVLYLYLLLRMVVEERRAVLFSFLFASSAYFMLAPLSYALNADILQVPVWLGVVYHFVRAARSDRLFDWVALAIWAAVAVLTKYAAGVLFLAGIAASLRVPAFRRVWGNPRLYMSIALGLALLVPHAIALEIDPRALEAVGSVLTRSGTLAERLWSLLQFGAGTLLFLLPAWAIVAFGLARGSLSPGAAVPPDPEAESSMAFFSTLALSLVVMTALLVLGPGVAFNHRYPAPYFGVFVLALAPFIRIETRAWASVRRWILLTTGLVAGLVIVAACLVYGVFTGHGYMQEPAAQAASRLKEEWDTRFSCGPGYVLGDGTAHVLALSWDPEMIGLRLTDTRRAHWYDPVRLQELGAVVVYRQSLPPGQVAEYLPALDSAQTRSLTLPLRRTLSGKSVTYEYAFLPPADCGSPR